MDAHPKIEFFMEPFADYAGLFPGFPERNQYLSPHESAWLINLVRTGYQQLYQVKYPLFYRNNRPLYFKQLDRFLISQFQKFVQLLKIGRVSKIDQYKLLHLHNSAIPINKHPQKNSNLLVEVTKELRLNFKVGLLAQAFPGVKCMVIIRHPGAQISSIKNMFQRGHLSELNRTLISFIEDVKKSSRFKDYWPVIETVNWDNDLENQLILWWLINYQVLAEDIQANQLDSLTIHHEKLSQEPYRITQQILDFCGLTFDQQVRDYLDSSSHSVPKQNERFSPVDTTRESGQYYKKILENVEPALNHKIFQVLSHLAESKVLAPCITDYYDGAVKK